MCGSHTESDLKRLGLGGVSLLFFFSVCLLWIWFLILVTSPRGKD
jgi:hypothetical protein